MKKRSVNNFLKKFWDIVWRDDSIKGWLISLIFIFIVIKLIFFPLLALTTGTSLPLVIVESCSMYHQGNPLSNLDNWWESHDQKYKSLGITEKEFKSFSMKKGFNKGDILFITRAKPEKVELGDVIIFSANYKNPIIHRVIDIKMKGDKYYFSTIGDNNNGQLVFENDISEDQLVGKASFHAIPYLGWAKLIFFELPKKFDKDPKTNFEGACKER